MVYARSPPIIVSAVSNLFTAGAAFCPQLPDWLQKGLFDGDPRAQLIVFNGCTLVGKKSNGDVDWGFTAFGHGRIEEGSKLIWGSLGSGNGIAMVRVEAPAAKAKKSACSN